MGLYICQECGGYRDSDDGCYERGEDLICPECYDRLEELKEERNERENI